MRRRCGRIRGALQVIVVVAPALPRRAAALRLAVLPVALSALTHVVVDTGTFDACATGAGVLVRPPEPDHILQFVISIARYQRSSDADDAAHAPMPTPTPPAFARAFLHLIRLHRRVLAALALLPPVPFAPASRASSPGGTALHQYMNENENENENDEDRGEEGNRDGQDEGEREREDPVDTYGRAYYVRGGRALGPEQAKCVRRGVPWNGDFVHLSFPYM